MGQNGFAIFFILVVASCALALVRCLRDDWQPILSALRPAPDPDREAPVYRTTLRTPAELPTVAERLRPRSADEPQRTAPPPRRSGQAPPPRQLPLDFERSPGRHRRLARA